MKKPEKGDGGERAEAGGTGAITPEMKNALREKLKLVKRKVLPAVGPDEVLELDTDGEDKKEEDSECSYVPTPDEERLLMTGTSIPETHLQLAEAVPRRDREKTKKAEALKDITTKSLSGQLILRAVSTTKARKQQAKKKKKKHSGRSQLTKLLTQILTKESSGKKDKTDKKKRKRRRMKDGVIVSSTGSSSEASASEEEDEETDSDLEAPLRRKSRDKPGSVLALLTEHVREQLDQSSLADMPSGSHALTGGVKIASYFALHVKGQFPQSQRELREMYSLAATMDLLRKGDVARVGDSLAARFMAIHQALLDQGWHTAKHMELHSMDDANAATASLVLASRKHSRLVEKVQGRGYGGWYGKGKGKGRGGWQNYGDGAADTKGGKGKDGKKGKGKGRGGGGQNWDNKVGDWEKKKEAPAEK